MSAPVPARPTTRGRPARAVSECVRLCVSMQLCVCVWWGGLALTSDARLGREAHRECKLTRVLVHAARGHDREAVADGLAPKEAASGGRAHAVVGQGGSHHRQLLARDLNRAKHKVQVQRRLEVSIGRQRLGLPLPCIAPPERPVKVLSMPSHPLDSGMRTNRCASARLRLAVARSDRYVALEKSTWVEPVSSRHCCSANSNRCAHNHASQREAATDTHIRTQPPPTHTT
jgi:hypothetical protein